MALGQRAREVNAGVAEGGDWEDDCVALNDTNMKVSGEHQIAYVRSDDVDYDDLKNLEWFIEHPKKAGYPILGKVVQFGDIVVACNEPTLGKYFVTLGSAVGLGGMVKYAIVKCRMEATILGYRLP
ncbi:hypothetical protein HDV00_005041 [Rhizophlyctis rosea]|nr:hypothetical protein HDV00_005041 [Rhizophlyctis rosea]